MIDWTINIGHILVSLGFLGSGIGCYFALKNGIGILTVKLDIFGGRVINIETEMRELGKTMTAVAVQDERIVNLERRQTNLETSSEAHRKWVRDVVLTPRLRTTVELPGGDD